MNTQQAATNNRARTIDHHAPHRQQDATLLLYHYTTPAYLASILQTGLKGGEIPLTPRFGLAGPSLTRETNPSLLVHARVLYHEKTRVRLSVEIPAGDPLLIPFNDLGARFQHDPKFLRKLGKGSRAHCWFAYLGPIPADRIRKVEVDGKTVDPSRYLEIKATWPRKTGVTRSTESYRTVTPAQAALSAPPLD